MQKVQVYAITERFGDLPEGAYFIIADDLDKAEGFVQEYRVRTPGRPEPYRHDALGGFKGCKNIPLNTRVIVIKR